MCYMVGDCMLYCSKEAFVCLCLTWEENAHIISNIFINICAKPYILKHDVILSMQAIYIPTLKRTHKRNNYLPHIYSELTCDMKIKKPTEVYN